MDQNFYDRVSKSKFYDLGDKLGDIILLCLCWLGTSLPVVTLATSSSALYYAINKRIKEESGTPVKDFFHSFKQNAKQGIILSVILLLYAAATGFNIAFAVWGFRGVTLPDWYLPFALLLLLPLIFTVTFVSPYLSRFTNHVRGTLFHSFTFSTMHLGHTLLMWLYILLSAALMIFFFPSLLFAPYICCYLCWRICEKDFSQAMKLKEQRANAKEMAEQISEAQREEDELLLAEITEADLEEIEETQEEE